ncbi:CoA-binding protein, partial [Vibrio parahaemolyticus]|nr:CoA-binding protein [Vibrio parahaemolyticus]
MSQRGLEALLRPKSIAVIGASEKLGRAGTTMMKNLLSGGFNGPVFPINPARGSVSGVFTYPSIDKLPQVPDLAIICTHHRRNLELLKQLGESGCKAVIVLSAQPEQFQPIKLLCQQYHIRLLGPNSLGLLAPWQGLNASFSPLPVKKGKLAFISQS